MSVDKPSVYRALTADSERIAELCAKAWWDTYADILPQREIEEITRDWYSPEKVAEYTAPREGWDGWWVYKDSEGHILGAAGWGMTSETDAELFDLYVDIHSQREGIGRNMLSVFTQRARYCGAKEQWVAVVQRNHKGISFYLAQGFSSRGERSYPNGDESTLLFWRAI